MSASKRACVALAVTIILVFLLQNNAAANSRREDVQQRDLPVGDRISCRWLGLCGVSHIEAGNFPIMDEYEPGHALRESQHGHRDQTVLEAWEGQDSADATAQSELKSIPKFVLDHAPLVHLFSEEVYWPSDITEHLKHITPTFMYDIVEESMKHPTVNNLEELNAVDGELGWKMYLQSNDNIEDMPAWLTSEYGIPVFPEDDKVSDENIPLGSMSPTRNYTVGGRSSAPVVLMVTDKGNGVIDAMWHFFYSYNLGNGVFGIRFGNHVGDWEHTVMRFHNGTPVEMFLSEHAGGVSYTYKAMEKDITGKRPVIYSAVGTHAMYAKPGVHPYIIPFGILKDATDKGPLWDPALNYYAYIYEMDPGHDIGVRWASDDPSKFSNKTDTLTPTRENPDAPVSWFHFSGHWGDRFYPLSDKRQYRFFSEWAHVSGPPGPKFKAPGRKNICFKQSGCTVLSSIEPLHWFLRVSRDWLIVCIVVWAVVVIAWGVWRGVKSGWRCCTGFGRRGDGSGERGRLLTGGSMTQPISYGAISGGRS